MLNSITVSTLLKDTFSGNVIAGIKNVGIAFDKVELKPYFPGDINCFSLKMKTPKGQINIRWDRKDKIIFECGHDKGIKVDFCSEQNDVIFNETVI